MNPLLRQALTATQRKVLQEALRQKQAAKITPEQMRHMKARAWSQVMHRWLTEPTDKEKNWIQPSFYETHMVQAMALMADECWQAFMSGGSFMATLEAMPDKIETDHWARVPAKVTLQRAWQLIDQFFQMQDQHCEEYVDLQFGSLNSMAMLVRPTAWLEQCPLIVLFGKCTKDCMYCKAISMRC